MSVPEDAEISDEEEEEEADDGDEEPKGAVVQTYGESKTLIDCANSNV